MTILTSIPNTFSTIDKKVQWELLVKQIDFWKPKSRIYNNMGILCDL
jgi:hypothetical protein